jgi:xylulokinase
LTNEHERTVLCNLDRKGAQKVALLGIDVGTSELKATLFSDDGASLTTASVEYSPQTDNAGFAELDPELLWSSLRDLIQHVVRESGGHKVVAVGISSHGESFVVLGRNWLPVTRFILNVDSRAAEEMAEFVAAFSRERLYQITGLPPHPMYTLPKIAWLRKHAPDQFDAAAKFVCVLEYLLQRATGETWIDFSLASRMLALDVTSGSWDKELLRYAGISASHLAQVSPGGRSVGRAREAVARELGLPRNARWVTGGHDQACCSLGAGALAPGTVADGTGTFECISVATERPMLSSQSLKANLPCGRHTVPDRYLTLTYAPGGVVLKWFRDRCGRKVLAQARETDRSAYEVILSCVPDEPTGLLVLPYLLGTGTPWMDPKARATVHGITYTTTCEALVKAALEGVTYEMRSNLEMLERLGVAVRRIVAVGGGAKSSVWLQLKADIFGREVVALAGEASCRGAALCAGVGSGVYRSFEEATQVAVRPQRVYEPRPAMCRRYNELFQQYKEFAKSLYGYELPACLREPISA